MYVHLGGGVTVPSREVAAVFDLDNATTSIHTRRFLERAQEEGMLLPRLRICPNPWWSAAPRAAGRGSTSPPCLPPPFRGGLPVPAGPGMELPSFCVRRII